MFFGQFHHKLNAKNQVTIPSRFRQLMPEHEKLYILRMSADALYLYTQGEIEKVMQRVRENGPAIDPEFRRVFASRVTPVDMDAQGRIVISQELKSAVGIETDVAFIGNAERVEIWPFDRWQAFEKANEAGYREKLGTMMDELFEK